MALDWLAEHTKVSITAAVPCTVADQPPDARDSITIAQENGRLAELIELEQPGLSARAYHARNRWMVDRGALVIGFPHGDDPRSGTCSPSITPMTMAEHTRSSPSDTHHVSS